MKRIKGAKNTKLDLPENVDGACGEVNIVDRFREFYEGVYNSSASNEALEQIKDKVSQLLSDDHESGNTQVEVNKLTGDIVKQAAVKMKPKKGDLLFKLFIHLSVIYISFITDYSFLRFFPGQVTIANFPLLEKS